MTDPHKITRVPTPATVDAPPDQRVHLAGCSFVVDRSGIAELHDIYEPVERFTIIGTRGDSLDPDGLLVLAYGQIVPAAEVVEPAGAEGYVVNDELVDRLETLERLTRTTLGVLVALADGVDADLGVVLEAIAARTAPASHGITDRLGRHVARIVSAPEADVPGLIVNAADDLRWSVVKGKLTAARIVEALVEAGAPLDRATVARLVERGLR